MKLSFFLLLTLFVSVGCSTSPPINRHTASARDGGDSSGGGNSVKLHNPSRMVLLDFYVFSPDRKFNPTKELLVVSTSNRVLPQKQKHSYTLLQSRLKKWRDHSPALVEAIEKALKTMFFYSANTVKQYNRYYLPDTSATVIPIIAYERARRGGIISKQNWDRLDLFSQAGLFIHEALRHIQLYDEIQDQESFSDKSLQEITARLMLTDPPEDTLNTLAMESSLVRTINKIHSPEFKKQQEEVCELLEQVLSGGSLPAKSKNALNKAQQEQCEHLEKLDALAFIKPIWFVASDQFGDLWEATPDTQKKDVMEFRNSARDLFYETLASSASSVNLETDKLSWQLNKILSQQQ